MDMSVNNSQTTSTTVGTPSAPVDVQQTQTLLQNLNQDQLSKSFGSASSSYSSNAHDPSLPKPADVPGDAPMQNTAPTDYEIASQYDAAVMAGIKQQAPDPADADRLTQAFLHPDNDPSKQDPVLTAIMNNAQQQVNEDNNRNSDEPIPQDEDSQNQAGLNYKQEQVTKLIQGYPDLYANGKFTDKGNQTLRAIMTGNTDGNPQAQAIDQAANQAIGFTPTPDPDAFNAKIGLEFEGDFEQQIANLSPQDQKTMEYLFNMDPTNPQVAGYISAAKGEIQQKWGIDVPIITENVSYNFKINGEYLFSLDQNIKELGPQLSSADISAVKNYLIAKQNGQSFTISDDLKAIGDQASVAALADVQTTYGVPTTWTPDTKITLSTFTNSPQGQMYLALSDQVTAMKARIDTLPPSPEKTTYLNLMQLISDALSKLQAMILTSSSLQAAGASAMSRAQASLLADKTDQMKAAETAREAQEQQQNDLNAKQQAQADKNAILGPCMIAAAALLVVIGAIISVVTLGLTAPLVIGLVLTVVILCITYIPSGQKDAHGQSESCMSVMMNGINSFIDNTICGGDPQMEAILGTILRVVIIVALVLVACLAPGGWMAMTPLIMAFLTQSGFIQKMEDQIVKASGGTQPPEWVAGLIAGLLTILVIIAAIKGGGGEGAGSAAEEVAGTGGEEAAVVAPGAMEDGAEAAENGAANAPKAGEETPNAAKTGDGDDNAEEAQTNSPNKPDVEQESSASETQKASDKVTSRITKRFVGKVVQKAIEMANAGLQIGANLEQAQTSFTESEMEKLLAKTVKDVAGATAKSEEIEAIIKMMQTVINNIDNNMGDLSEWAKSINQQVRHQSSARSQMMTHLTQAS